MSSTIEELKTAGDTLFVNKDFSGAYKKYTEALKHDSSNAVLFISLPAAKLTLDGRYMDALSDAIKATDLNPSYAKAWGRLAAACTGLNKVKDAVEAWRRAVAALPKDNLTPAEQKQQARYSVELATAQQRLDDFKAGALQPDGFLLREMNEDLPWKRALAVLPSLTTWESSAWVIAAAYKEWDAAASRMKQGKAIHTPQGSGYLGQTGVIVGLTNALIADERVFHITDEDFCELYNNQLNFEAAIYSTWTTSGSRELMEVAPKRLATEGWDSVRPALSNTVRAWIMRAFIEERLVGNCEAALDLLTSALEVLRWGQTIWKDVSHEDKGAIFRPMFVRGVKCLRLNTFMSAYTKNPGPHSPYSLDELLAGAQDLLDELVGAPTEPQQTEEYGSYLSSCRYPAGQAHAVKGFYYNEKAYALRGTVQGLVPREVINLYLEASKAFVDAATCYPVDDELYPWYLHCALHAMLDGVGRLTGLLPILDSMKRSIPLVKRIWEFGANWSGGRSEMGDANSMPGFDVQVAEDMVLREKLLQMTQSGEITGDTLICLRENVVHIIRPSDFQC